MRAFVNGKEGAVFNIEKGSDVTMKVVITNDDGSVLALGTDTVSVDIHDTPDRVNAATLTASVTVDTAANGACTLTLTDSNLSFGPGKFYAFVYKTATAEKTFARKYFILNMR